MALSLTLKHTPINMKRKLKNGLNRVYGIGNYHIQKISQKLGVRNEIKIKHLHYKHLQRIKYFFETKTSKYYIPNLPREKHLNLKRLVEIKSRRGIRLQVGLPVHGQRTRSNHQTSKRIKETVRLKITRTTRHRRHKSKKFGKTINTSVKQLKIKIKVKKKLQPKSKKKIQNQNRIKLKK